MALAPTEDRVMSWAEFRQWALETYGKEVSENTMRPVVWDLGNWRGYTYTGTGAPAVYKDVQRRRFAVWLRLRDLIAGEVMAYWLTLAENFDDGWLVGTGHGRIRWVADPASIVDELLGSGFVAIKCGAD